MADVDLAKYDNLTDEQVLARVLDADKTIPEQKVAIPRLEIPVILRALDDKQIGHLREQCTRIERGKRGRPDREVLDTELFNIRLLARATKTPDWGHPKLIEKYRATGAEDVIRRVLLPGEIAALVDVVLDLSGFYNSVIDLDDLKNSSESAPS